MAWPILIGAAIGAGIGQATGGNTKSTLTGAGLGALGGWGYSAATGAGGVLGTGIGAGTTAAKTGAGLTFGQIGANFQTAGGAGGLITGGSLSNASGASAWSLGSALSNPLLLGTAGMGLASAFTSTGTAFQDKIALKPEGRELMYGKGNNTFTAMNKQGGLVGNVRDQFAAASRGDTPEKAFRDISNLKEAEAWRNRATQGAQGELQGHIGNQQYGQRGTVAGGGQQVQMAKASAGERMQGLFAPYSALNDYKREELMNAIGNIQNIHNLENQTASINYRGALASWQVNQQLASQRGAAIGGAVNMLGTNALTSAYMHRMDNIGA